MMHNLALVLVSVPGLTAFTAATLGLRSYRRACLADRPDRKANT